MIKSEAIKDNEGYAVFVNKFGDKTIKLYKNNVGMTDDMRDVNSYEATFYERLEGDLFQIKEFIKEKEVSDLKKEVKHTLYLSVIDEETNEIFENVIGYEYAREIDEKINNRSHDDIIIIRSVEIRKSERINILEIYKGKEKQYELGYSCFELNEDQLQKKCSEIFKEYKVNGRNMTDGRNITTEKGKYKVFINGKAKEVFELRWDAIEYGRYMKKVLPMNSRIDIFEEMHSSFGEGKYRFKGNKFKKLFG
ncbi:hypothetical protein [Virgibacillus sp. DJP39]|uniref:hypothetical protein n=1 Tax=Virgibacillus sp. DJP39 TaxID=3409790 RepID=UPI003BB61F23